MVEAGEVTRRLKRVKNKVPMLAELGEEGLEKWIELELKLVADVGVIGAPNAGKSSLLAAVSAARPKIADYPFTTIVPNLGLVERDYTRMVFADVPGLLEGASEGLGLGFEFFEARRKNAVVATRGGLFRGGLFARARCHRERTDALR